MHPTATTPTRRSLLLTSLLSGVLSACSSASQAIQPSVALGRTFNLEVIDRDSGQPLEVYPHRGRYYVAGRPGARYAIRITNRSAGRLLAVTAVDGINILNGQTAAWGQSGYVFAPWQSFELTGWRKSDQQVAAFEFTSLPDSYAVRTGRPLDVGVIGVAVFREKLRPVVQPTPNPMLHEERGPAAETNSAATLPRPSLPASPPVMSSAPNAMSKAAPQTQDAASSRLGTGHGERETSWVSRTAFERASSTPEEIISVQYDRYENLAAAGIIPGERFARPRPFPGSRDSAAYVPDPPGN